MAGRKNTSHPYVIKKITVCSLIHPVLCLHTNVNTETCRHNADLQNLLCMGSGLITNIQEKPHYIYFYVTTSTRQMSTKFMQTVFIRILWKSDLISLKKKKKIGKKLLRLTLELSTGLCFLKIYKKKLKADLIWSDLPDLFEVVRTSGLTSTKSFIKYAKNFNSSRLWKPEQLEQINHMSGLYLSS